MFGSPKRIQAVERALNLFNEISLHLMKIFTRCSVVHSFHWRKDIPEQSWGQAIEERAILVSSDSRNGVEGRDADDYRKTAQESIASMTDALRFAGRTGDEIGRDRYGEAAACVYDVLERVRAQALPAARSTTLLRLPAAD
jgi:hypothetical protein